MIEELASVRVREAGTLWEVEQISAPSLLASARQLRERIIAFFSHSSFTHEELADVELAVGEACANAVKHGSPRGVLDEVRVKCMRSAHALVVEISDSGFGFDPDSVPHPSPENLKEHGMGIHLMRTLMDSVEFEFGGGTTVRLTKYSREARDSALQRMPGLCLTAPVDL